MKEGEEEGEGKEEEKRDCIIFYVGVCIQDKYSILSFKLPGVYSQEPPTYTCTLYMYNSLPQECPC